MYILFSYQIQKKEKKMSTTSASEIFDLRNLYYYQCGNIFTGSRNGFNYKIIPEKEAATVQI